MTYSDTLTLRIAPELNAAVDRAARARGTKASEWVRQTLQIGLALDGIVVEPLPIVAPYDELPDLGRCYAWVEGDQVMGVGYHTEKPEDGRTYLPVNHVYSEPFDVTSHWHLKQPPRIEGDRVIVEFRVIPKTLEHA